MLRPTLLIKPLPWSRGYMSKQKQELLKSISGPKMEPLFPGNHISKMKHNYFVLLNALLGQKCSYSVSQSPRPGQFWTFSLLIRLTLVPANQILSICLFLVLYSLAYKRFLPSAPSYSSPNEECSLYKILNKVCLYHLNCLIIF